MKGKRLVGAFAALAMAPMLACSPPEEAAGTIRTLVQDARYQLAVQVEPSVEQPGVGGLRFFVETRGAWHLAAEASVSVELEGGEAIEFEPAKLGNEQRRSQTETRLELAGRYRVDGDGPLQARGQLKLGICSEQSERCEIVRRSFELPMAFGGRL